VPDPSRDKLGGVQQASGVKIVQMMGAAGMDSLDRVASSQMVSESASVICPAP